MILRTDCRCCRSTDLIRVFSLGEQPFANAFLRSPDEPEQTAPLDLMECQSCGHVQLQHVAAAADLFRQYAFQTGSSRRMVEHFARLMDTAMGLYASSGGLVVEIGSNDGGALATLAGRNVRTLGVDPAENLAAIAERRGVTTVPNFFTEATAEQIAGDHGPADVIVACNVLAHVDDLDDFCRGVNLLLARDGALIIEVPRVDQLIDRTEFDTIYHEHLSYFGIGSLITLLNRHGLRVEQSDPIDVHGGSMRVTARRGAGNTSLLYPHPPRDWTAFNRRCRAIRANLLDWLHEQRDRGRTVWGYGAAAKATVMLNYCGITTYQLPAIVDTTPTKQGRYMPGTHQPILHPRELLQQMPDAAVVLAWNHLGEIVSREAAYTEAGGRLVSSRNLPAVEPARASA